VERQEARKKAQWELRPLLKASYAQLRRTETNTKISNISSNIEKDLY
jgi:hypothetical protein